MTNHKLTAWLLAGAIAVGLCGGAVLAADPAGEEPSAPELQEQTVQEGIGEPETDVQTGTGQESEAAEQTDQNETVEDSEDGDDPLPTQPDPTGTLSFANVDRRVRSGDYNCLVLEETIAQVEATDYEKLQEDLRQGLNDIANLQWQLHTMGGMIQLPDGLPGMDQLEQALQGMVSMSTSSASQTLQAQYDALRQQFDDLKEGKIQKEAEDTVRQLRSTQDGLVLLAQSMYVQLSELQATEVSLDRAVKTMDRQLEELELRYQLGQISSLSLQQAKAGRTSLASQKQSLTNSISSLTMNLQSLVGGELTGSLRLAALPQTTAQQLEDMDLEADLTAAKEASYTLYAAKKALDDAEETYQDAGKEYNYNEKKYQFVQAQHAWQAAQYTYSGALQSFELSFRTLYAQVKDYQQVLQAAQTALAVEEENYSVDQLKYEQGTISKNTLLAAEDDLAAARDKVNTARRNLFSAYNNYRWAVDRGILN